LVEAYDIIGDVHGCAATLDRMVAELGYDDNAVHPDGRRLVFVGDCVHRGRRSQQVLTTVMDWVEGGKALAVAGNRDLAWSPTSAAERQYVASLPFQLLLDENRLLVVHAAVRADLIGRTDPEARYWMLAGAGYVGTDGRYYRPDWQATYTGEPFAVAGHSVVRRVRFGSSGGGSAIVDTGASHGRRAVDRFTNEPFFGYLSALRWPEREVVSVDTVPSDLMAQSR
jgi:protein phosphatase